METEAEHDAYDSEDQEEYEEDEEDEEYEENEDEDENQTDELSYMKCIQSLSDTKRVIYLSATLDPPTDGSLFFEYKVRQAIDEGYLCDYQFVFPIFEQEYVTNEHLAQYLVHKQHESHCVIYAPSCKEGKEFTDMLNELRKGCAGYIDADTSYKERQRLFAEFESGAIHFLINIRILVEGFNAPHIRSIFFLQVSTSEIFIIQAIGRALRLHCDKRLATIYVPFTQESDAERIQTFLHQLSTYDERIKKTISEKKMGGYLSLEHWEDVEEEEDDEKEEDTADLFTFRYNLIVNRMGNSNQLEEMAIKRALEYKAFYEEHKKKPTQLLCGTKKDHVTEEHKYTHRLAQWFNNMKQSKKRSSGMKLYPSVEKILIELLGEKWYENKNLEELAIKQALEYKTFYQEKQRKPLQVLGGKTKEQKYNATEEQKHEYRLANWFSCMKLAKKGKGGRMLYPSVEKILIGLLGNTWYENENLEEFAIHTALKYKTFYQEKQQKPSLVLSTKTKTQKENASEEQKHEHKLAQWLGNMKIAKKKVSAKGDGGMKLYPSVENILIKLLGETWYENKNLEENAIKNAIDYKEFYERKKQKPALVLSQKTKRDNATDEQKHEHKLAQWLDCMKKSKTKPNKDSMKLYPSVETILIELLGESWYENENLEEVAIMNALEYKTFYEEKKRKPLQVIRGKTQKENATEEHMHEQKLAQWLCNMKNAKKKISGTRMKLYLSVEKILIELLGETWYDNKNLEENAIKNAIDYRVFYEGTHRIPSQILQRKGKKDHATAEQTHEHRLATWVGCMKQAKKGKGSCILYPSVEEILVETFRSDWFTT